jgi:primosomal replication protein N
VNRYTVIAKLIQQQSLRYTPAGIPALDFRLLHESQDQNGHDATIELGGVAFGLQAETLVKTALGSDLKVDGFLRHSAKSKNIILQVEHFETLSSL